MSIDGAQPVGQRPERIQGVNLSDLSNGSSQKVPASAFLANSGQQAQVREKGNGPLGSLFNFLGRIIGFTGPDNTSYERFTSGTTVISGLSVSNDRRNILLRNAARIRDTAKATHEHGVAQILKAKNLDPWSGLGVGEEVPMSSLLKTLADATPEQRYYHNCLSYQIGNAVANGKVILDIEDIDGTETDKSELTWWTRRLQPFRQIHENNQAISSGLNDIGIKMRLNTARGPGTVLLARNDGLEGAATYGMHNSPLEELAGLSLLDQIDLARRIDIAMLNGSMIHYHNGNIYFSNKLLRAEEIFKEFPEFVEEFLVSPAKKYEYSALEPKGVAGYLIDTYKATGEAYYPHLLQIAHYKERYVDSRDKGISLEDGWINFAKALKKDVDSGLEAYASLRALKENLKLLNLSGINTSAEISELENLIHEQRMRAYEHVLLVNDYYDLLKQATEGGDKKAQAAIAQTLFEKCTEGRLSAICVHFFNSRGTPHSGAIDEALCTLRRFTSRNDLRIRIKHLNFNIRRDGSKVHNDIAAFVLEGKKIFREQGAISYLNWRLLKHMMHHYKKSKLAGNPIFECAETELKFSKDFQSKWERYWEHALIDGESPDKKLKIYMNWLAEELRTSKGPEREIVDYMNTLFPEDYIRTGQGEIPEENFYPDELFSINNKIAYTGEYAFYSVFALVDKRDPLKPDGQFYLELQPAREKFSAVPTFQETKDKNYFIVSAGDSPSDTGTHVAALERGGIARIIYGLITEEDIYDEAISQKIKYVKDIANGPNGANGQRSFNELKVAWETFGAYGLEKDKEGLGYRKVIGYSENKPIYLDDGKIFTRDEIVEELRQKYVGRIDRNPSPAAKIRRWAEVIKHLTGADIDFSEEDLARAKMLHASDPNGTKLHALSPKDQEIYKKYRWAIVEERYGSLLSLDTPRFRVYFEYHDPENGLIYYRRKEDGNLVTKDGKLFAGNENNLQKVSIKRSNSGNFVYASSGEIYPDQEFLNNVLCEEEFLPNASPVQGLFSHNNLLKLIGGGDVQAGKQYLKSFVIRLPRFYNAVLEVSGGLMAVGGVFRLVSKLLGGEENILHKTGYWISNGMRAVSAFAGALRGLLNVNKYYDITFGEIINVFSALLLPNGPKHLGLGIGNLILFLGRGRQRAQIEQRVNSHTKQEIKKKQPSPNIVDPRPYVREVTRFSAERLILGVKNIAKEYGLSGFIGEVGGNIVSAVMTPVKMIQDIIKDPRLILQIKNRMSEKAGVFHRSVPSAGHLLSLVGVFSGIGSVIAGTLGRVGEVSEHGFNKLGNFFISFANAIPALGIIANGFEVAANPQGRPLISRGLDGKDITYDPKRAGLGQVFAGILYAIIPWFGLHNDVSASAFDIATATYFGIPKTRISVAEEEKLNTMALARSILIEGQEFYAKREDKLITPEVQHLQAQNLAA